MIERKRSPIVIWIIPLFVGLAGFYRVTQSPSFELYRAVDIVQLLGCGVCFGSVMVGVILMLRRGRSRPSNQFLVRPANDPFAFCV
jgi:hypothetical protein